MVNRYIRLDTQKVVTFKGILTFDLYFKLNNERYLILFSKGSYVEEVRLKQYLQKRLLYLYVLVAEQEALDDYLLRLNKDQEQSTHPIENQTKNPAEKPGTNSFAQQGELTSKPGEHIIMGGSRVSTLLSGSKLNSEDFKKLEQKTLDLTLKCAQDLFFNRPIRPEYLENTHKLVHNFMNILSVSPELISVLLKNINKDSYFAYHSMSVSVLSLSIAQEYASDNIPLQILVGVSGFLHDIGKSGSTEHQYNPAAKPDLIKNPIYLRHPEAGLRLLRNCKISEEVRIIVAQHHEEYDGRGFPNRVNSQIFFPSRIVSLANKLSKLISPRPFGAEMPVEKALEILKAKLVPLEFEIWKGVERMYKATEKAG